MGAAARIGGVLFSPRRTYEDIVRRPGWLAPVVLLTLISVVFIACFTQRVGWEPFIEQQFAKDPRAAEMPAERRAQAIEQAAKFAGYAGYASAALGTLVVVALLGGIFLGAFNILAGAGTNYKTSLAITSHAMVPAGLASLLGLAVLFLKDPDAFDLENPLGSNLAALLSEDAPQWLGSLGRSLDLFVVWMLILAAVGFSITNPKKVTTGKALAIIGGLWGVFLLVKVGIAAATGR